MKRIPVIFLALFILFINVGSAQSLNAASNDDHNAYPLVIALVVLALAIITRLITVSQSRKQGNAV